MIWPAVSGRSATLVAVLVSPGGARAAAWLTLLLTVGAMGASAGAGLGHAFLRHVERTRILVHVVDLSAADPERDYEVIREELEARDPRLLAKTTLVLANKMDLGPDPAVVTAFHRARAAEGLEALDISASRGDGLGILRATLRRLLPDAAELARPGEPAGVVVHRFDATETGFTIERDDDEVFHVRGRRIERLVAQTDFGNEESAARFQRDLERLGVDAALRQAGVQAGDTVRIGEQDLEWDARQGAWA